MSFNLLRSVASGASAIALLAAAPTALAQAEAQPARDSTPFTLETDQPRTAEQQAIRFDKADLSIRVLPEDQAIDGVAVLDFTVIAPIARLAVELDTLFTISEVQVDGETIPTDRWANPEGRLTINLARTLDVGAKPSLRIAYAGKPRVAPRAPWNGGFVWAKAPSGEPWVASAMQLEGCDLIFPCIDNSNAEPGQVDLHVTVPAGLVAPGNGVFQGKTNNANGTTTWNWRIANPNIYAVNITVGPYEEVSAQYQSRFGNVIPMHYWHLRSDDPADVRRLFAEFPIMLDFFESTIGPYPFGNEKMGVVETPHLGMEHQTINAYGNGYALNGRGYDTLLQHEFAHEWFANQLTNRNADDMWLHEGLGSYMQPLYARWLYGDRYMQAELADQREGLQNRAPIVSGGPKTVDGVYDPERGPGGDIYNKGSLVAHSMRMLIGDDAFFKSIRRLVYGRLEPEPGNFQPVLRSTPDFQAIVKAVSGRDLGWFFKVYLYQAALPVLIETRDGARLSLAWDAGGSPFPMPIEIEIDGRVQTVDMPEGRAEITLPPEAHVLIDPENKVLRRLDHVERYTQWRADQAEQRGRAEAEAAAED